MVKIQQHRKIQEDKVQMARGCQSLEISRRELRPDTPSRTCIPPWCTTTGRLRAPSSPAAALGSGASRALHRLILTKTL